VAKHHNRGSHHPNGLKNKGVDFDSQLENDSFKSNMSILKSLENFSVIIESPVAWGDMDAFQHVNNTVYFKYFESIRMHYGEVAGMWAYMRKHNIGPILKDTYCRFSLPLTFPDSVSIGVRTLEADASYLKQEYAILSHQHNKIAATGWGQIVAYDYNALKKVPLPDAWIEAMTKIDTSFGPAFNSTPQPLEGP
jgi:acyl-CoA thioester hydrolase